MLSFPTSRTVRCTIFLQQSYHNTQISLFRPNSQGYWNVVSLLLANQKEFYQCLTGWTGVAKVAKILKPAKWMVKVLTLNNLLATILLIMKHSMARPGLTDATLPPTPVYLYYCILHILDSPIHLWNHYFWRFDQQMLWQTLLPLPHLAWFQAQLSLDSIRFWNWENWFNSNCTYSCVSKICSTQELHFTLKIHTFDALPEIQKLSPKPENWMYN